MYVSLTLHLPREAASVTEARHMAAVTLASLAIDAEDAADILLALTEACANVIDHAAGGRAYDVTLTVEETTCVLRVTETTEDASAAAGTFPASVGSRPAVAPEPEDVEALLPSGRGLALMAALMDSLCFSPVPGGTSVELVKQLRHPPTPQTSTAT